MRAEISSELLVEIRRESARAAPNEACGLLFGEGCIVSAWQAARNVAEQPDARFEIDPVVLFAALRSERAGGPKIVGYWHSHPSEDASPSATDAAMADSDGKLWLIVTTADAKMWRSVADGAVHGRFDPVDFQ